MTQKGLASTFDSMTFTLKSGNSPVQNADQAMRFLSSTLGVQSLPPDQRLLLSDAPIVIRTDDCIQGYIQLVNMGVQPCSGPEYTAEGLQFGLRDPFGNEYRVIEERNYIEFD